MIQEAYCSYEVSKLLKEKGFNEPIRCWYDNFQDFHKDGVIISNTDCLPPTIMCPTHQMAMKWLREKFNLHVDGNVFQDFSTNADDNVVDEWMYWSWNIYSTSSGEMVAEPTFGADAFDSYEEAVEAALKYCLENLI